MTLRTIEVSGEGTRLSLSHRQVVVERDREQIGTVPAEDIGVLVVDTGTAVYTHWVMTELMERGAAVVFCGPDHLPIGVALPVEGNHLQAERLRLQIEAGKPLCKRIWKSIVQTKIYMQSLATTDEPTRVRLAHLGGRVRSGDPDNIEAQAAQAYWKVYLPGTQFRRRRDGEFPNPLLNYGYMVMRAAIARAIVAAGFHPSLGLKHSNRYNAFALADDLLEPLRPLVDSAVRRLVLDGATEIDRVVKTHLLGLLNHPCRTATGSGPLSNAFEPYVASFHKCLSGRMAELDYPFPEPYRD